MGKLPAMLFYPGDWTRDLDDYDLEIEGAWIRLCCRLWWSPERGKMTKTLREYSKILRKSEKKTMEILNFLLTKGISSGSILDNQNITIISRRMVKDNELSIMRQRVGKLGGNPGLKKIQDNLDNQSSNQNATKILSSSSSSSSFSISSNEDTKDLCSEPEKTLPTEQEVIFIKLTLNDKTEYPITETVVVSMSELYPAVDVQQEFRNMKGWLDSNPTKRKTKLGIRKFYNSWLSRAQDKGGSSGLSLASEPLSRQEKKGKFI